MRLICPQLCSEAQTREKGTQKAFTESLDFYENHMVPIEGESSMKVTMNALQERKHFWQKVRNLPANTEKIEK